MQEEPSSRPLTIGMVAGEASGDNLGAPLVREILKRHPHANIMGVGGPAMIAEGFSSDYDIERLSVNGFVDPLMRLPDLIRMLFGLRDKMVEAEVDCFVGIDFNFFNLLLEGLLKKRGIKTVHYVSPTVWAWRRGRLNKIKRSTDLMMTLYPFEVDIYREHGIGVSYVGHPKAIEIAPGDGDASKSAARAELGLSADETVVAVLPGSRSREVEYTGADFLDAASLLADVDAFVIPAANERRKAQIESMLNAYPETLAAKVRVVTGESKQVMAAADVVMVNSGTATLEAMLLRRPMIMSYRLGAGTYAIVSRLVTTDWFALPNILAGRELVKEFIQHDAEPEAMAAEVRRLLSAPEGSGYPAETYAEIHANLAAGGVAGQAAAEAVIGVATAAEC